MRGLVSKRPNVVPVGIGNSTSSIDMSTYLNPVTNSTDYEGVNSVGVSDEECGGDATSEGQDITEPDGDDGDTETHIPAKSKATEMSPHVQKPNAHTGGTPVVKQEHKKTRTVMMDKFSDITKAQEDTAQRAIDMKVKRLALTKETDIARIKAQECIQVRRDRQRLPTSGSKDSEDQIGAGQDMARLRAQASSTAGQSSGTIHGCISVHGRSYFRCSKLFIHIVKLTSSHCGVMCATSKTVAKVNDMEVGQ